ncbi:DUF1073 domain-containing protein [bacterium]|nr:DUF1073 domain-containing protein [bacterium]
MAKNRNKSLKREIAELKKAVSGISMDTASPSGGWSNPFNAFGLQTDPTFDTSFLPPLEFTYRELTDLYQNPLVRRVVNLHANDGTRKGFKLKSKDDAEKAADIKKEMDERFNWLALIGKMIAIRHLYGGGVLFCDIDDGLDPEEPLNEAGVRKVWSFQPVDRWYAHPRTHRPLFGDERPGQPMHYQITLQGFRESRSFMCHESRVIRFPSYESDDVISQVERVKRLTWPIPTAQLIYDAVKRYGIGMQSSSQMMQGFVEDVFKVAGLKKFKDPEALRTYIREQRLMRNSMRATVIGDEDDLQKVATPSQGMIEINHDIRIDVGMVSEIPVPILFSEESGALGGSTLDQSRAVWFDSVATKQPNQYTPIARRMLYLTSLETGWEIDDIDFDWVNLWTPTEAEEVTMRKTQADTDKTYYDMGLEAKNIFDVRFSGEKTNLDGVNYDPDEFEKHLEEMEEKDAADAEAQLEVLKARQAGNPQKPKAEPAKEKAAS